MRRNLFSIFHFISKFFSGFAIRERFPPINGIYIAIRQRLAPKSTEIFGFTILLDPGDSMNLAVNSLYEPLETAVVSNSVNLGDVVLDIGANIGYFTLLFSKLVGQDGKVFAFEPDPRSFDLLHKNVRGNRCANVVIHQKAVTDGQGELILYRDKYNNLDHRTYDHRNKGELVEVSSVQLDEYLDSIDGVDFIKMDIQGGEGFALDGMKRIIQNSPKLRLLTEFWPQSLDESGYGARRFVQSLFELGFEFYLLVQPPGAVRQIGFNELLNCRRGEIGSHTNLLCVKR